MFAAKILLNAASNAEVQKFATDALFCLVARTDMDSGRASLRNQYWTEVNEYRKSTVVHCGVHVVCGAFKK